VKTLLQEFRPTILFLVRFLAIYFLGNLVYAWYVGSFLPQPDPVTISVSEQSSLLLNWMGNESEAHVYPSKSVVYLQLGAKGILTVYEGCNGLNVAIVFLSFLLAFGPCRKSLFWFAPLGLLIIHVSNLCRIVLLFFVTLHWPSHLYFVHKYLFTAFIYLFVFLLWIWWVMKLAKPKTE
jgi:exosortase family protein XrtF